MPRKPRLDCGLLQHVIVRGIERRKIFIDDEDSILFLDRFSSLLEETGTDCFAWALIPNYFYLLIRCNIIECQRVPGVFYTGLFYFLSIDDVVIYFYTCNRKEDQKSWVIK